MKSTTVLSPVNIEKRAEIDLRSGDTVRVSQKIQEKGKTRLQMFEGLVLARKGGTRAGATFTVRRVVDGVGVEKTFPLYSPMIDKIEVVKRSKVRRSKLLYIREKAAKEVRKQMKHTRALGKVSSTGSDMEDKERVKKEAEAEAVRVEKEAADAEAARALHEAEATAESASAVVEESGEAPSEEVTSEVK